MKNLIIDRFEEEYAVCEQEDGQMTDIKRILLPKDAKEGDCIILNDDNTFEIDHEKTEKLRQEADDLFKSLLE